MHHIARGTDPFARLAAPGTTDDRRYRWRQAGNGPRQHRILRQAIDRQNQQFRIGSAGVYRFHRTMRSAALPTGGFDPGGQVGVVEDRHWR